LSGRKLDPTPPLKSPVLENRINITVSTGDEVCGLEGAIKYYYIMSGPHSITSVSLFPVDSFILRDSRSIILLLLLLYTVYTQTALPRVLAVGCTWAPKWFYVRQSTMIIYDYDDDNSDSVTTGPLRQ